MLVFCWLLKSKMNFELIKTSNDLWLFVQALFTLFLFLPLYFKLHFFPSVLMHRKLFKLLTIWCSDKAHLKMFIMMARIFTTHSIQLTLIDRRRKKRRKIVVCFFSGNILKRPNCKRSSFENVSMLPFRWRDILPQYFTSSSNALIEVPAKIGFFFNFLRNWLTIFFPFSLAEKKFQSDWRVFVWTRLCLTDKNIKQYYHAHFILTHTNIYRENWNGL